MITEEHIKEIKALSSKEKLELMNMLWDDVSDMQDELPIPENHKRVLNERMAKYERGESQFTDWEILKKKYER